MDFSQTSVLFTSVHREETSETCHHTKMLKSTLLCDSSHFRSLFQCKFRILINIFCTIFDELNFRHDDGFIPCVLCVQSLKLENMFFVSKITKCQGIPLCSCNRYSVNIN